MDQHRVALVAPVGNRVPKGAMVLLGAPVVVAIVGFVVVPLIVLATATIDVSSAADVVRIPGLGRVVWFTIAQACAATLGAVVVGVPLAVFVARHRFAGRRMLLASTTLPFMLPTVVTGAALTALAPGAVPGVGASVVGHVYVNLAVVLRIVSPAWAALPQHLLAAAHTLGATRKQALATVAVPVLRRPIVEASLVTFVFCAGSFGLASVLGGPRYPTVEVEVARRATQLGDVDGAALLACLQLLVFSAVALVLWRWRRFGVAPTAPGAVTATTTRFQRLSAYGVTAILVAPLAMLAVRAFTVDGHTSLAGWRVDAARRPNAGQGVSPFETIGRSLFLAAVATAIATPLGAAAATGCRQLVRAGANRTAQVLEAVTLLPLACSAVTVGLGLLITYDSAPFDWRSSWIMVPLGQALVALPLVTRVIRSALDAQPVTLLDAAATLGVAPTRAWQSIELAGVRPAVAAAAGLAAAVSLGDFGAASVLSRSGGETAPVAIARLLSRPSDVTRAQGFALALMLAAVTMVLLHVADRDGALDARRS